MSKTVKFTDWLYEILTLHFRWVVYLFKGFIVLGFFPATSAVFAVVRDRILNKDIASLPQAFKQYYHENFRTANILGWLFTFITSIIIINLFLIPYYPLALHIPMYAIIAFTSFILVISWIYLFPTIVHFQLPIKELFLVILKTGFSSIPAIVIQIIAMMIILLISLRFLGFFILFGVTPYALIQMSFSLRLFKRFQ